MDTTVADPLVGRLLDGRYSVRERIAKGGMATVYAAVDTRLDRPVAVKVMHAALAEDDEFVSRFHGEATAAARLTSPHVVAVLDQGTEHRPGGPVVFLVMELIKGQTLRHLLARRGRLTASLAVEIFDPVLDALASAHAAGLIHRDIKPENILLGDDGRVKVADFGLARAVQATSRTATGLLLGTVGYLSPEQMAGEAASPSSDVYAAGVVLFEMLTGRQPHRGDTPIAVAYQHVHGSIPPPSSLCPDVPPALDRLVSAATAREPGARPPDAWSFLTALRAAAVDLPPVGAATAAATAAAPAGAAAAPQVPPPSPGSERTRIDPQVGGFDQTQVEPDGGVTYAKTSWVKVDGHGGSPPTGPLRFDHGGRPAARWGLIAVAVAVVAALLIAGISLLGGGSNKIRVPSLVGLDQAAATKAAAAGKVKIIYGPPANNPTVPRGQVAVQDPAEGAKVKPGSTVRLTLSLGPQQVKVPDLRGKTLDQAKTALIQQKLGVAGSRSQPDDTVADGQVISTEPAAGSSVNPGDKITLVLSSGSNQLVVPDVTGQNADDAEQTLRAEGFDVGRQDIASNDVDQGKVVRTSPDPGQRVNPGEKITLFVSSGPDGGTVQVPDVTGQSGRDATETLKQQGLRAFVVGRRSGEVKRMFPDAGSQVDRGSQVTLFTF